jgi:hypothetical protein
MFFIDKKCHSGILRVNGGFIMMKRHFITLGLALLSGCFLLAYLAPKNTQNSAFKGSNLAQELFLERKAVHDQCLSQIKQDLALEEPLWLEYMGEYEAKVAQDSLLGTGSVTANSEDPEIITTTRKVLVEYGVNPEKVTIKLVNTDTPAQAVQGLDDAGNITHRIELDLSRLNKYSPAIQEALVRHEIMHVLNYDSLEGSYLITMLYKCGYSAQELEKTPAMIAYRHQRELRADLLAGCDHPEVAHSLQEFFASFMKITDQDNAKLWTSHPSDKQRHEQLAQLLVDMGENPVVQA